MVHQCFPSTFLLTKNNNSIKRSANRSLTSLALAFRLVTALVTLALNLTVKAVVRVSSLVAQVGVDGYQFAAVLGDDTGHVDLARALFVALAVAARAVDLAVVLGVEVDDVHGAAAVVLDDLIRGVEGAAADDVGGAVALETDGVFADVFEPDEFEVAGSCGIGSVMLLLMEYLALVV